MQYLYLDNFRGFKNTYFPIEEVNFLVGENSTGKTSMMGILELIFSVEFWFQHDFNSMGVNFGHFNDIVSANSNDRSYFNVGFIQDNPSKKNAMKAFLMTFIEKDGLPFPFIYIHINNLIETRICFEKDLITYNKLSHNKFSNTKEFIKKVFKNWPKEHVNNRKKYKEIPKSLKSFVGAPPVIIATVLGDQDYFKKRRHSPVGLETPINTKNIAWLAPVRSKPRRTYDEYKFEFSPEGDHTPYLIKKMLDTKSIAKEFKKFIKKVGKESGLFEDIIINKYGKGATAPFEVDVIINKKALNITSVGYGISQVLPVIVELFTKGKGHWYAIQQPEVHLHPKAQASLGDILFGLSIQEQKIFFVETHSDHTIDRFRLNYRKKDIKKKPKAQLLYFERKKDGNRVHQLSINENGELPSDQPEGYRKFFIKEDINLLGL